MIKLIYMYIIMITSMLLIGCSNKIIEIEEANNYSWQKYMNDEEYAKIKNGMSYMDVVEIAGGAGELQEKSEKVVVFLWLDERLMTQAYEIEFSNDEVTNKKVVERKGQSIR